MMKKWYRFGLFAVAAMALMVQSGSGEEHGKGQKNSTEYHGVIASVNVPDPANNPGVGTVTITTKSGDVIVNVDGTTSLRLDGVAVTDLPLFPVGDKAEARVDNTTGIATKLRAETPTKEYEGVISAVVVNVDVNNVPDGTGTVTITREHNAGDVVVNIATTTKVKLDGVVVTDLSLLAVGDEVEARVVVSTGIATKLSAETPGLGDDD
ncbi:MAG: hypothetical protein K8T25_20805 [Planctomycetia bacterium]|nr:hypothetical protein [Planctomycetia bacterium]